MAQPEHPYPERDELIREHVPCPDCTAGRGEPCRDVVGAEVPTHERRVSVYIRDFVEPFTDGDTEQPAGDESGMDDRA